MTADEAAVTLSGGMVVSPRLREEVAMRIRRALLAGELKPGQRIKESAWPRHSGSAVPHAGFPAAADPRGTPWFRCRTRAFTWRRRPGRELADVAEVRVT